MLAAGLLIFFLVSLAMGRPAVQHSRNNLILHERRASVPNGFKPSGAPDPDTVLNLRFALVQSDPAGLEKALYDVSTPGSKNFRQYFTKAQVRLPRMTQC